jgi:hypothetical protein
MGIESLPAVSVRKLLPSAEIPGAVYTRVKLGWTLTYWLTAIICFTAMLVVMLPVLAMAAAFVLRAQQFALWLLLPGVAGVLILVMLALLPVVFIRVFWPYLAPGRGPALVISDADVTFLRGSRQLVVRGDAITEIHAGPYSVIELVAPGGITRGGRPYGPAMIQIPGRLLEASQSELVLELDRRFGERR